MEVRKDKNAMLYNEHLPQDALKSKPPWTP